MRKQLSTNTRCWTTHIFKKVYKNKPPMSFRKSAEIIETMHSEMIDHLFKTSRPIQIRKSIGYLELTKKKTNDPKKMVVNWKKTKERGKLTRELNHHTSGYVFSIGFQFAGFGSWRVFDFTALRKHKRDLKDRIINKDVQ